MLNPVSLSSLGAPETPSDDIRIGGLISFGSARKQGAGPADHFCTGARASLIGFESDAGVHRNGGRIGAAEAPDLIRSAFYRMTPDPADKGRFSGVMKQLIDLGNLNGNALELGEAQQLLGELTATALRQNEIPVILGGGHETSFGHFLGYAEAGIPVSILNWDAHADVRPLKNGLPHSGSPFFQALEHESGMLKHYTVCGLNRHSTAQAHLAYLGEFMQQHRAAWYFKGELNKRVIGNIYDRQKGAVMVTMDMDALHQHIAPGVSAPNADGLSPELWLHAARCAGRHPGVRSFDLVEMNPRYDTDGHTARIAALTLWHFFKGLSERWE